MSYIVVVVYWVYFFEWFVGVVIGIIIDFVLERGIFFYELIDDIFFKEWELEIL